MRKTPVRVILLGVVGSRTTPVVTVSVDAELAPLVQELQGLWQAGLKSTVREELAELIAKLKQDKPLIANLPEDNADYVKSWGEILNLQVYVDTEIYGDRPLEPTGIQHDQATEVYLQSWAEVAKEMQGLPDNLFTKLWTTVDIAKILGCSPDLLRKARKERQLPLKVKEFMLDCVSHDGKRSLWFVRPA
ncbi:MAG: hypothetical protein ACK4QL_05595 [Pseudanabaenaceae cyanobacterium]